MSTDAPILECVPNFSEGVSADVLKRIIAAMQVPGVSLLDFSRDSDHNRSVVTIAGSPEAVVEAAVRAAGKAAELIDLTRQTGVHPRIGAADVIPFVPVHGLSLAQAAMYARQAGLQIFRRFGVPIYFYEAAAARPDRVLLENVRRGQFEGLRDAVRRDATRRPDIGGPDLHPTAGASAVGARNFLIAYNIFLDQSEVGTARAIAKEIRASSGGMSGVKAMGVMATPPGSSEPRAQVSMNITDFRTTSVKKVHETVHRLAKKHGATATDGELIGLIPQDAYEPEADWIRQIPGFDPDQKVLERKLLHPLNWDL